jgi:hypothetical protein
LATATVGTALLQEVLRDSPKLVAQSGELLMISSTLAEPEIRDAVPSTMSLERVASRLVPFDLETVRGDSEKDHVQWLKAERGLEVRNNSLYHNIGIYRIAHTRPQPESLP